MKRAGPDVTVTIESATPLTMASVQPKNPLLVLRCERGKPEAYLSREGGLPRKGAEIRFHLDQDKPRKNYPDTSVQGDALFLRKPKDFIKELPRRRRLAMSVKAGDSAESVEGEATFSLTAIEFPLRVFTQACRLE